MSVRVICDVCHEAMPLRRYRLRVTGDPHPHTGEQIRRLNVIDICGPCLERVPDLATERTVAELVADLRPLSDDDQGGAA